MRKLRLHTLAWTYVVWSANILENGACLKLVVKQNKTGKLEEWKRKKVCLSDLPVSPHPRRALFSVGCCILRYLRWGVTLSCLYCLGRRLRIKWSEVSCRGRPYNNSLLANEALFLWMPLRSEREAGIVSTSFSLSPSCIPPTPIPSYEVKEWRAVGEREAQHRSGSLWERSGGSGGGALGKALWEGWEGVRMGQGEGDRDHIHCQSTASQALCWALYGDSLVTSAVVVNS